MTQKSRRRFPPSTREPYFGGVLAGGLAAGDAAAPVLAGAGALDEDIGRPSLSHIGLTLAFSDAQPALRSFISWLITRSSASRVVNASLTGGIGDALVRACKRDRSEVDRVDIGGLIARMLASTVSTRTPFREPYPLRGRRNPRNRRFLKTRAQARHDLRVGANLGPRMRPE